MIDFDTYIKMGEPGGKERAEAWKNAIFCKFLDKLPALRQASELSFRSLIG